MTGTAFTRRSKALTIVPLALLSGAWTVSLVTTSAGASDDRAEQLPDGSTVPTEAIEAPASVPQPGVIAPGVPVGTSDQVVASATTGGIPSAAISAYQRGAQIINAADKACNIPWELIAAIGRVESNHGRYGGNTLSDKGVATPGIYGIPLNGKNNTQAINDTDGGELDDDTVYDRAVGPMQFIPSTWAVVKVDADGDGERNPQDIDDAALATGVYLCSGSENLSERKGQETAVYRYNHSKDYVNLVLRLMEAYQQGDYTAVPSGSYGGTTFTPDYSTTIDSRRQVAQQRKAAARAKAANRGGGSTGGGTSTGGKVTTPGTPSGSDGGVLPGTETNTGGGDLGETVKKSGETVKKKVEDTVKDPVGTVTNTLTEATASAQCLAKVGADSLTQLNLLGLLKVQSYNKCMDGLGF